MAGILKCICWYILSKRMQYLVRPTYVSAELPTQNLDRKIVRRRKLTCKKVASNRIGENDLVVVLFKNQNYLIWCKTERSGSFLCCYSRMPLLFFVLQSSFLYHFIFWKVKNRVDHDFDALSSRGSIRWSSIDSSLNFWLSII